MVPVHWWKDVWRGLFRNIINQSGLGYDYFLEELWIINK